MRIMLDCRPLQLAGSNSEKYRLIGCAVAGLSGGQDVEWLFVVDHTYRPGLLPDIISAKGHLLTLRSLPGSLGWKLWYDWQLPRLVKRHKPDLLMVTGGVTAKPSGTRQCVWMPVIANPKEAAALASAGALLPGAGSAGSIVPVYAARLGNSVRQAETILCFSEKDRNWLAGRGHIDAANIVVVRPYASPAIHPLSIGNKEAIRQRYTGGKEYFFVPVEGIAAATGAGEDLAIQLLKAFSLFKKRQLSNLQLVLAGTQTESLRQRLETYKYRGDIHWVDPAAANPAADPMTVTGTVVSGILSAAYAILFPFEDGSLGTTLLNAWKARVPALVARGSRLRELVDNAAVIAGVDDPAALAGYMMAVYKDETQRNALIEKGASGLADFDPVASLAAIRKVIGREINKIN